MAPKQSKHRHQPPLTVGEAARELTRRVGDVTPKQITDAFYQGLLDDDVCPVVGGRRLIPPNFLPTIERVLRGRGLLGGPDPAPLPRPNMAGRGGKRAKTPDPAADATATHATRNTKKED